MELTNELVAIHSHICGDGNIYLKEEHRSPSSIRTGRTTKPFFRYVIEYTNKRPELLNEITYQVKTIFPDTYVYRDDKKFRVQARNKTLYTFLRNLEYVDGYDWIVPEEIVLNKEFRRIWLRAFFDDEGSVYESCLVCYNTNREAILQINEMLILEGFETSITKRFPNNSDHRICYTIRIKAASYLLFQKVGFNHLIKKKKYYDFCKKRMRRPG